MGRTPLLCMEPHRKLLSPSPSKPHSHPTPYFPPTLVPSHFCYLFTESDLEASKYASKPRYPPKDSNKDSPSQNSQADTAWLEGEGGAFYMVKGWSILNNGCAM